MSAHEEQQVERGGDAPRYSLRLHALEQCQQQLEAQQFELDNLRRGAVGVDAV